MSGRRGARGHSHLEMADTQREDVATATKRIYKVAEDYLQVAMSAAPPIIDAGVNVSAWYTGLKREIESAMLRYLVVLAGAGSSQSAVNAARDGLDKEWMEACEMILIDVAPEIRELHEHPWITIEEHMQNNTPYIHAANNNATRILLTHLDDVDTRLHLEDKIKTWTKNDVMNLLQNMYMQFGVNMSPRPRDSYPEHIKRLYMRMWDHLGGAVTRILENAKEDIVAPQKRGMNLEQIAQIWCMVLFRQLAQGVMFIRLHLADRALTPDSNAPYGSGMLDGKFGRTRDWTAETGVPHGQWPMPIIEPDSDTDGDTEMEDAGPPRTPPPVPIPSTPPPTVRATLTTSLPPAALNRVRRQLDFEDF